MRVISASSAGEPQSEQNLLPGAIYEPQLEQCILVGPALLCRLYLVTAISSAPEKSSGLERSCLSGGLRFAMRQNRREERLRFEYP